MRSVLFALLLMPLAANAHQVGISRSEWSATDKGVRGTVILAQSELNALDGAALEKAVLEGISIEGCAVDAKGHQAVEADGLLVTMDFTCPAPAARTVDLSAILERLGPGHRHLAEREGGESVLTAANARFTLGAAASREYPFLSLVQMGVEHILSGPDHLLFLLGLILGVRKLRDIVWVATAFTVGHSISLSVATLGWVVPPSRVVEPLIALSLVWVGVENILRGEAKGRWRIAAAFGLIHGFGFASALRDLHLPDAQVGWALLGFNVGVEFGQLAVLLPLVPLLTLARRKEKLEKPLARVLSFGVAAAGAVWFVVRIVG